MSPPRPTRRVVLRGGAGVVVLAGATVLPVGALTGCARTPEGPDELESPLMAARTDAALAASAATAFGDLADRLTPVAQARRAHAEALAQEVRRARPDRVPALDSAPAPTRPVPASSAEALGAVRDALGAARDVGTELALRTAPYRCGLLASVAASCAGHTTALA